MARPLRVEFPGAFYHVMNRGNAGEHVLSGDDDKQFFLDCLQRAADRFAFRIHTYCLMDNHYHLVVETPEPNLSQAMQLFNVTYASWYNRQHQRNGHIFQGRFKALLVDADAYLTVLSRYIHLNPVRARRVTDPQEYSWSSCRDFLGQRRAPEWLSTDVILESLHSERSKAIELYGAYLTENAIPAANPQQEAVAGFILGRADFFERIKQDFLAEREDSNEIPQLRQLKKITSDSIVAAVAEFFGESSEVIRCKGNRRSTARLVAIGLARKYCRMNGKELGNFFGGVTGAAITMATNKLERLAADDPGLKRKIVEIETNYLTFKM